MTYQERLLKLARERLRAAACTTEIPALTPDRLPAPRDIPCGPGEEQIPDVFLSPPGVAAPSRPPKALPDPLVVPSPAVIVFCPTGAGSVTLPEHEAQDLLYLTDIDGFTTAEIYRLADQMPAIRVWISTHTIDLEAGIMGAEAFDAGLMALTIEAAAAAGLRIAVLEMRENLRTLMELSAISQLHCLFESSAVYVICDETQTGGFRTQSEPPDFGTTYVARAAGFFISNISQEDADVHAVDDALRELSCVYLNDEQTVTCADLNPDFANVYSPAYTWNGSSYTNLDELADAGFRALTLGDVTSGNELGTPLTYRATVSPSSAFAAPSKEEANELARTAALLQLQCFFPSREGVLGCVNTSGEVSTRAFFLGSLYSDTFAAVYNEMDTGNAGTAYNPALNNQGILNPFSDLQELDLSIGLQFFKLAGLVVSGTSQALAEQDAQAYALTFLDCSWKSPETTCACVDTQDSSNYFYSQAELSLLGAHLNTDRSSGPGLLAKAAVSATTYPGLHIEDPNDPPWPSIGTLCLGTLECLYCNDEIAPSCTVAFDGVVDPSPDDGTQLYTPGVTPLPLTIPTGVGFVSDTITSGSPANQVCDVDPRLAVSLALAASSIPPVIPTGSVDSCVFHNQLVEVACSQANLTLSNPARSYGKFPPELALGLSSDSTTRLVVSAGVYPVTRAEALTAGYEDPVAYATFLALEAAKAYLVCQFGNVEVNLNCFPNLLQTADGLAPGAFPDYVAPSTATINYGDGTLVSTGEGGPVKLAVSENAAGAAGAPVTIPAGRYFSFVSLADANQQALDIAKSQLDCYWDSPCARILCGALMPPANFFSADVLAAIRFANGFTLGDGMINHPQSAYISSNYFLQYGCDQVGVACGRTESQVGTSVSGGLSHGYIAVLPGTCSTSAGHPTPGGLPPQQASKVTCGCRGSSTTPVQFEAGLDRESISYSGLVRRTISVVSSQLDCFTSNWQFTVNCPAGKYADGAWVVATVKQGAIISYISQTDADLQAWSAALGALNCLYTNEPQTSSCGAGIWQTAIGGSVPACTVTASTSAAANAEAKLLAEGGRTCIPLTDLQGDCIGEGVCPIAGIGANFIELRATGSGWKDDPGHFHTPCAVSEEDDVIRVQVLVDTGDDGEISLTAKASMDVGGLIRHWITMSPSDCTPLFTGFVTWKAVDDDEDSLVMEVKYGLIRSVKKGTHDTDPYGVAATNKAVSFCSTCITPDAPGA